VRGNSQALFGKRPTEKDPAKGTSPAVDFTRREAAPEKARIKPVRDLAAQPTLLSAAAKHGINVLAALRDALEGHPWATPGCRLSLTRPDRRQPRACQARRHQISQARSRHGPASEASAVKPGAAALAETMTTWAKA
jgi:hypothetical protein